MNRSVRPEPRRVRTAACLLILAAAAGCTAAPGSFPARFTERGRLLVDGPRALMTPAAIAESQAESVPLLYAFATQAGQVVPVDGRPYPATALDEQQRALRDVRNWPAVVLVGERYIDASCDRFLAALDELERSRRATLANLNALQSATVGILGLAVAAQKTIGIVGVAFGLAVSLLDNTSSAVLYQLPASAIRTIVNVQRDILRLNEARPSSAVSTIDSQGQATAHLADYVQYCMPVTIEANIARVLNNSVVTNRGAITVLDTQPVIGSPGLVVTASVTEGRLGFTSGLPGALTRVVDVPDAVQRRKVALKTAIYATSNPAALDALAAALGVRFAGSLSPADRQKALVLAMDSAIATAGDMDRIAARLAPILGTTF